MNKPSDEKMLDTVRHYHEVTKHHPQRYARSLGYMDWATQPDPFRRFEGAPCHRLEEVPVSVEPLYDAVFENRGLSPQPVNHHTLSQFIYDSLALSLWKSYQGSRWALRVNPSSGNLHPTEGYLLCGAVPPELDQGGVFHYAPYAHELEKRFAISSSQWAALSAGFPDRTFFIGLTSIYWRESWKYGERAFRYCQHDVGHALAALSIAGAVLGWRVRLLNHSSDDELAVLLGVNRQSGIEAEHVDGLLAVCPADAPFDNAGDSFGIPKSVLSELASVDPAGSVNRLSEDHHAWPIIDEVSQATTTERKSSKEYGKVALPRANDMDACGVDVSARRIIRQRRSAVAMDGETKLSREAFYRIMLRVTPMENRIPFDMLPWRPKVHLGIFVHRVVGLEPGLYFLVRDPDKRDALQAITKVTFTWKEPDGCPLGSGLFLLEAGDFRHASKLISCDQDIAADGAFSLGMIADFTDPLRQFGPVFYRRLFWETGVIGQVLYLEAEALGVSGTGIGCFYDDVMHEVLGFGNNAFQSLYHFTIGGRVDDPRLQNVDPYEHL